MLHWRVPPLRFGEDADEFVRSISSGVKDRSETWSGMFSPWELVDAGGAEDWFARSGSGDGDTLGVGVLGGGGVYDSESDSLKSTVVLGQDSRSSLLWSSSGSGRQFTSFHIFLVVLAFAIARSSSTRSASNNKPTN